MTSSLKEPSLLLTALRQYRHNHGEGFVFGYDKAETDRVVMGLIEDRNQQYTTTQPSVQGVLVGWVWHSYNQTNFTSGSHHKEVLEAYGVKLTPVYTSPQQAPEASALVEALEVVKAVLESDDPAIADTIWVPGHVSQSETLYDHICSALAEYRQQGGDV